MVFEAVPFVDEEQDCDCGDCEDDDDEEIAHFGDSFPPETSSAGLPSFVTAGAYAAADS